MAVAPSPFFGFGIPMLLAAAGAFALWSDSKPLIQRFGWTCTMSGLIWAASLFFLLAGWVGIVSPAVKIKPADDFGQRPGAIAHFRPPVSPADNELSEGFGLFLGFGIPMLVSGGVGIKILIDPPAGAI